MKRKIAVWPGLLLVLLLGMLHRPAAAVNNCSLGVGVTAETLSFTFNENGGIYDIRSVPVGGVIASATATTTRLVYAGCNAGSPPSGITFGDGSLITGVGGDNTLYSSTVPGVGIRLSVDGGNFPTYPNRLDGAAPQSLIRTWTMTFIKTSTASSGNSTFFANSFHLTWRVGDNKQLLLGMVLSGNVSFTRTPRSCVVLTPNLLVDLSSGGPIPVSKFTGVGSTSKAEPIPIRVDCTGVVANIHVTVTDQRNPANTGTSMALSDSTATGLGIQILSRDVPMAFGPDSPGGIYFYSVNGGTGVFTYTSFTARYIQTGATVTPGSAKGVATFTFTYQ